MKTAKLSGKKKLEQQDTFVQLVSALALIVIIAGLSYFSRHDDLSFPPLPEDKDNGKPDYFAIDATIHRFDATGEKIKLEATSIFHHINKKKTYLKYPHLEQARPDSIWTISADQGTLSNDTQLIELKKNVVLTQQTSNSGRPDNRMGTESTHPLIITTSLLKIDPDNSHAITDRPVKIVTPEGTTNAVGMNAYYQESDIELLSNVRGIYAAE